MEGNVNEENSQENDKGTSKTKQNNENNKNTDGNAEVLAERTKTKTMNLPSTSSKVKETNDSLLKLTQRTNTIFNKLAAKRQQLHLQNSKLKSDKDALKENDLKVLKTLQTMGKKPLFIREKLSERQLPNGAIANGVIPNGEAVKPLNHYSKKQLENLVEGLQELVYKLTLNNRMLRTKAQYLTRFISGLENFPLFEQPMENVASTSAAAGRQRCDSDYTPETKQTSRKDSEKAKAKENEGKNKKDKEKQTPAEIFAKYINSSLAQYLGDEQPDLLEKYKCSAAHIEDLESYAMLLVEAGYGRIVESEIRINRKNNRQSFITMSTDRETSEKDGMILMPVARRYAFEGDIVRAFVFNPSTATNNGTNTDEGISQRKMRKISSHITGGNNSMSLAEDEELFDDDSSPDTDIEEITDVLDTSMAVITKNCRKAFVIRIVKQTELREVVGSISFINTTTLNSKTYFKLKPHDMRVPMVYIPKELCQEELKTVNKEDICGMLYVARVLETDINGHCIGELVQPVGKVGNLQAEIKAILLHNGLKDIQPYEQKFLEMYDGPMPTPSEEDLKNREDLRKKCVFTIDPLTAKDLDDAVSVEKLNDKEYEIGVHISDVAYYLQENSELDNLVKHRATSIYLVNEVIHMLPPSLCFRCSLLPGEDKFAFSVFWKWHTEKEEFSAPRFTRSIINSCSQFAYEHAQKIIDNPEEEFDNDDFPELLNEWTPNDIKWRVLLLQQIAQKLKAKRYENGALSINNPKLRFQLDPKTGEPIAYEIEGRKEANFLIEEFMLLANQSVAKFIHDRFPDISILRNHSPPLQKSMKALKERLNNMGLEFDISSSKAIYESMQRLTQQASDPIAVEACLSTLLTKPMARARYYCSEGKSSDADFWHYALSIPIYTHFTSPIRRYPDILVHRLLAAALNYCPPPQRTTDELHHLAKICNDQKLNAKSAGDESIELFFTRYVKAKQSLTLKAVVTEICKHMLNVVTIETGHTIAITYKLQKVLVDTTNVPNSISIAEKNSQLPPIKLQLFSTIDINLVLRNDKICGFFVSPDIKQRRLNSKESSKREKHATAATNGTRNRLLSNSISEQEDDNTPTTSSKAKRKAKFLEHKKKEKAMVYAVANDK
ncbi:DIS3-like exonuclease 2 [Lucilia sericata]|uniref:DIS3-like exonuclease 2 n=1 Tax=Lucilia sericata TaxID=13632 RepID=UPI0018A7EF15|nr:DIS3-like exonuclease 2 [Lucilia sericata]